jgi:aminopeptidase N
MLRTAWMPFTAALLAGCAVAEAPERRMTEAPQDPHSFARPLEARVTHVTLDLVPDFGTRTIRGTAALTIQPEDARQVVLDTRGLTIRRVIDPAGRALAFSLGDETPILGRALTIKLPEEGGIVIVDYETSPDAAALQWLEPAQTAGKTRPFLYTQGQAILTRTWIPTQDSPGVRQTYDASIHVPSGMRAVMGAAGEGQVGPDPEGRRVDRFRMAHPIPPYLIALAVGDLRFRTISETTGVYAEPAVVDRAATEFADVDAMVAAAEKLYGMYRWGRYDLLVLPPSFPYGGMENPRLTFATPTILAGDRSLVSLVAHELAHSWSGNLVTNSSWDDFWINEGFTTYIERRIMEELRGRRYAEMLLQLGRQDLERAIEEAGGPLAPDTRLHLDLAGRDPDEGATDIPYEKGSLFLQTIEAVVGRARLDAFLREYFDRFAFQPMTSRRLSALLDDMLFRGDEASRVNVTAWIGEPGLPGNAPAVRSEAFAAVDARVGAWTKGAPAASLPTRDWSTHEWLHFLRGLSGEIPRARLDDLDRTFQLSKSGNSEVLFAWLEIAIRNRYEPAFPALERFLTSQGRRKFLRPLYEALMQTSWGRELAVDIYRRARLTYHSVSSSTIDRIVK